MRNNKYFLSTTDNKFWFLDESDPAKEDNWRLLTTITRNWSQIDASFFIGYDVECEPQHRDKLFLVNFNFKTNTNEYEIKLTFIILSVS